VDPTIKKLRDWVDQTIFFAMNQKLHGGIGELFEQMGFKARAVCDRIMAEADRECRGDLGQMVLLVPRKVFDWVQDHLSRP
jgi:hypothetical protein